MPAPEPIKALYDWGYAGPEGEGRGSLAVALDASTASLVLEIHGAGERLALLNGDQATGYRLQIPRQNIDQRVQDLRQLQVPLLPGIEGIEGLHRLLTQGIGPGVKTTKRDAQGPVKMQYTGHDEKGREILVWLKRARWEVGQ